MSTIKNLFDAASEMEGAHSQLLQIYDALQLMDSDMEADGYQMEDTFNETNALLFAKRFPVYLNTFRVICRDLERVIAELGADVESAYSGAREERGKHGG